MRSLTSLLVALALVATLSMGGGGIALAQTGNLPSAPTNLMAVNGDNPGEVNLTWNAVPEAAFYRVGWVAFPDYESTVADGRNWLEAFHFFDAENAGQTQWTLTRLSPGVQYFFIIGSADERFGVSQWSEWSNALTLTSAPPAEVDYTSQYPNCDAVRAHYPGGVRQGSPIYRPALDRDGDGIACEPTSTVPTGDYLPIQNIGTFTGTGDSADHVIRMDAGVYRVAMSRQNTDGDLWVNVVDLNTGEWYGVGGLSRGESRGSTTLTIRKDEVEPDRPAGYYVLEVGTEGGGDWEVRIELLAAHSSTGPTGDLPSVQGIGTFTGTGDSADHVFRLEAGVYRVAMSHQGIDGKLRVSVVELRTGVWHGVGDLSRGESRGSTTLTIGKDEIGSYLQAGNYVLQVDTEGGSDWEVRIELLAAHSSTGPTGDLPSVQGIGTFTGTGDSADHVIRMDAGVYRVAMSRQDTDGDLWVSVVDLNMGREFHAGHLSGGESRGSTTLTIRKDEVEPDRPAGYYVLEVETYGGGDWEVRIELLAAHSSSGPTGDLPSVQGIGTFTGTGDSADHVFRLKAGVYRVAMSHQETDGELWVSVVELKTGERYRVGGLSRGESRGSTTLTIGKDEIGSYLQAGNYVLQVESYDGGDWEVRIELLAAH